MVRDGSGFVQCVAFKDDLPPELFNRIIRIPQETSVVITGLVREDKRAPGIPGGFEIGIKDLSRPDLGDPVTIHPGEVPVFWACGVTSTLAALSASLPLVITHAPGHMFVSDLKDEQMTLL